MGIGCSNSRKEPTNIEKELLKRIKDRYLIASQLFKEKGSPVITTPMLEIKQGVFMKLENFQCSGSFKFRGAHLIFSQHKESIVIASTGNFAKACDYAANDKKSSEVKFNQPNEYETPTPDEEVKSHQSESRLIVIVPKQVKKEKLKQIESQILYFGDDCVQSEIKARGYAEENHILYASPYNDLNMVAASCTIGEEIAEQFQHMGKQFQYLFCAVGGGGLIAGIAVYLKCILQIPVKIIGVQPENNAAMYHILHRQQYQLKDTHSDGTAGDIEQNAMTIDICRQLVDDWILIKEQDILQTQQSLMRDNKLIVEGAAAMAYAGCLKYPAGYGNSVVIMCGQNVDIKSILH